jgi:HPt (histidine-containing phosphotransfer) domain-containing protein
MLEVGMDGYIPKPLNRRELCKQLERWLPKEVDPFAWFDLDYVQNCFGEDQAFFREVLETFVVSSRELVATVELAWNEGNSMLLAESIHTLKGSSRSIGATQYAQFCQDCETAKGSDRHASAVRQVIDRAEELFLACQQIIEAP